MAFFFSAFTFLLRFYVGRCGDADGCACQRQGLVCVCVVFVAAQPLDFVFQTKIRRAIFNKFQNHLLTRRYTHLILFEFKLIHLRVKQTFIQSAGICVACRKGKRAVEPVREDITQ